jgi:hypothetical protein
MKLADLPRADQPPENPLFKELTEESYQTWRHHPVTAAYLRYLGDQVANYRLGHLQAYEAGTTNEAQEHERRGRILVLEELQELELGAIKRLYGYEKAQGSQEDV